jgi:hypothetical protein
LIPSIMLLQPNIKYREDILFCAGVNSWKLLSVCLSYQKMNRLQMMNILLKLRTPQVFLTIFIVMNIKKLHPLMCQKFLTNRKHRTMILLLIAICHTNISWVWHTCSLCQVVNHNSFVDFWVKEFCNLKCLEFIELTY